MKKRIIGLGIGVGVALVGVLALAGCGANNNETGNENTKATVQYKYSELSDALTSQNYKFDFKEDGFQSVQYIDKENKATYLENHFGEFIDKEYVFENEGKIVSVVYSNYTVINDTYTLNSNGMFEFNGSNTSEELKIENYFDTGFSLDKLFKEENGKIVSAGVVDSHRDGCDERTVEAKNIKNEYDNFTFDLNLVEIQDKTNHEFDRIKEYKATLSDFGKTKVEITPEIRAHAAK